MPRPDVFDTTFTPTISVRKAVLFGIAVAVLVAGLTSYRFFASFERLPAKTVAACPATEPFPVCSWTNGPDFAGLYLANQDLLGPPVGPAKPAFDSPLTQAFTYGVVAWYPHKPAPYQLELVLLGTKRLLAAGIIPDVAQVPAPIVAAYISAESSKGTDVLYWFGNVAGPPMCSGGECSQLFERAEFRWNQGALTLRESGPPLLVSYIPRKLRNKRRRT